MRLSIRLQRSLGPEVEPDNRIRLHANLAEKAGGAVTACRLAEQGRWVLILERGRRWEVDDYPRDLDDDWIWDQYHPAKRHGWTCGFFPTWWSCRGAGVGGGSLIYANISVDGNQIVA